MTPIDLLQLLCDRRETGLIIALTDDKRQLRIGLVDGAIVHVTHSVRRGAAGLETARTSRCASANFSRGAVPEAQTDLPDSKSILATLRPALSSGSAHLQSANGAPASRRPDTLADVAQRMLPAATFLHSPALDDLDELFVEYVGPIARVLIEQALNQGIDSWSELVERLARDVTPEDAAKRFRAAATRIVKR